MRAQGAIGAPSFVAYYRVSTSGQGRSGLGLDAQREAVSVHVARQHGQLVAQFEEVESGRHNDRPQLAAALAACRVHRAVLIVAKLDRLSRNAAFLLTLLEGIPPGGVIFADMPDINAAGIFAKVVIGQMALWAEAEAKINSDRTKAALKAAKARGVKLGGPNFRSGDRVAQRAGHRSQSERSKQRAADLLPHILDAQRTGAKSLREVAAKLTAWSIPPPSGGATWHAVQVRRIIKAGKDAHGSEG
jgi:DNA invertase Pin-like site-specific DNA recombinase